MASEGYIVYFRVRTARRGAAGRVLERQRGAVRALLAGNDRPVVAEFTEAESGGPKADRPQLRAALAACRRRRARLVVAELGRLRRSAAFLLALEESGVDFLCADENGLDRRTVGAAASAAREWGEAARARVRAGLASAKARGVRLGSPRNLTNRALGTVRGNAAKARRADERAAALRPIVAELRAAGAKSLREVAEGLNARGVTAPRGGKWSPEQLCRALART